MFLADSEDLRQLASSKGAFARFAEIFAITAADERRRAEHMAVSALVKPELVGAAQRQLGKSEALDEIVEILNQYK